MPTARRMLRVFCAALAVTTIGVQLAAVSAHAAGGPTVTITTPTVDGTNGWHKAQPTLTISASDSAGISSVSWSWTGATTASGSTPYSSPYPTTGNATTQPTTPGTSTLTATVTEVGGATANATATIKWDPDAPSQPTSPKWYSLISTSPTTTGSTATATWGTSTDPTSGVSGYRVQLSETTDFSAPLADHPVPGATTTSYTFGPSDGLVAGHSYYFRVAAIDVAGNTTWSTVSNRLDYSNQQTGPAILHAPVTAGFVGQSIPISLQATCNAGDTCSARLFYRPTPLTGANAPLSGGWTRVDLAQGTGTTVNGKSALTWAGSIPGTVVSTSGVDYFVEAEDNFALTQLPGVTYLDTDSYGGAEPLAHSFFHVHVVSPPLIVHQPQPYAQSGSAIPLSLQATCSTGNCTATLYYRTTTDGALSQPLLATPAWPRAQMQADPNPTVLSQGPGQVVTFRAQIPASYVDTRGVDYFFSVGDGTTTSWWPGTPAQGYYAPTDGMRTGYQHVHVLETPHITHAPVAQSPYRTDIPVDAQANCASLTCTGTLYYRTTTTSVTDTSVPFASAPMAVSQVTNQNGNAVIAVHGVIPAAVADTRGVDYFFSVSDGPTTSWWPGTSSTDGYVPIAGTHVGYQHVRVLEAPHFYDVPPATAPALQALTISAPATCATESCTVTLYYAGSTTALNGPFTAVPMTKSGTDTSTPIGKLATWTATIPAAQVTTRGLAYYLKAFDGYVTSYSPGTTYWGAYVSVDGTQVGVHPVRVLEPPHVVHAPVATAYYGQSIAIEARSNCATPACTATLFWDDLGGHQRSATMTAAPPVKGVAVGDLWTFNGTIPGSDVTTRGVHYNIAVNDGYVTDTTPTFQTTVLAPTAILHAPVLTANPAAPIPIDAVVPCSTSTCAVTLSYRTTGSGLLAEPAWTTVNMTPTGSATAVGQATAVRHYDAQIPANVVTTAGVDYFIKADDGSTQAYSPGTTWFATPVAWSQGVRTYYFHVHVAEPIHYTHAPVTMAPAGDPIHVVTQANCSTANCTGTLSYRTTSGLTTVAGLEGYLAGQPPFTTKAMAVRVVQDLGSSGKVLEFSADIPASAVTTDGVDYSFHLTDGPTNAYFPGTSYIGGLGSADGIQAAWQHVVVTGQHATGSIGDHVYLDQNGDGTQQSNESGLAGVTVNLTGAGLDGLVGTPDDSHASQTTDPTGFYDFTGLLPGTYRVDVDATTAPAGTIPTTPTSHTSNLGATQADYTADFGFRFDGSAAGTVFNDANVNHALDTGESGVSGVRVTLTAAGPDATFGTGDDVSFPAQTTDSAGAYRFDWLAPGQYRVDLDPSTFPATMASTSAHPVSVTLAPHQAATGVNFGLGFLPGAPTNVTATRGNASATVTWTAPASTGSGPLTSYTVTASPGGATVTVAAPATTATVVGLTNGTSYTFTVTAANAVGTGPASAPSNAVTPATVPGAPTNVSATPANTQATVTWTAPASNGGDAITSYAVTASPGGATATVNAPTTAATVTGLTNGTSYTFTVRATNSVGSGAASAPSNAVVPFGHPDAPTNVTATPADRSATVSWTAPNNNGSPITSYTVTASSGGASTTVNAPATTGTVTGLTNGSSYTFTVTATNAAGTGPASAPSNAVVPRTTPGAPSNVSATAGSSSADVSWTAPSSDGGSPVTSYTVTANPGGATKTVSAPATTATVTSLTPGTSYTFTVTAMNAAGVGTASGQSNPVMPYTTPGAPTGLTATAANASATVTWSVPASNGYSTITSYTVTASPGGATLSVGGMTTTATMTGLTNGTTYTFTVTATNAAGSGPASAPSNAVTPNPQIPDAPSSASATAGNASALVSWEAPNTNGSPITSYLVTASPGGKTATTGGTATQVAVGGLANGTAYTFTVRATNSVGNSLNSAPSAPVTPAATAPPYAARGLANVASLDTFERQGDADAWAPSVSADGRYVAFVSRAQNWLANSHGYAQVWVRDLQAGTTALASANGAGAPANGDSSWPSISSDGSYVAFASAATDLVGTDTNGHQDIFRRDLHGATTALISAATDGTGGNGDSVTPSISGNGNRIAFTSNATNLVATDRNGSDQDVFVRDIPSNTTVLADGTGFSGYINDGFGYSPQAALARSGRQAISSDGNSVVYTGHNYGGALHSDRCSGSYDIPNAYVANLANFSSPAVHMVGPGDGIGCYDAGYGSADTVANHPSISGDGTLIAYIGTDRQLHYFDQSGAITLAIVSLTADGSSPNQPVDDPWLNTNGRRATFSTTASNIVPGDTNNREDAFYVDIFSGAGGLISATPAGSFSTTFSNANGSNWPAVSSDGTRGVFASGASDLAANDLNGANDVFLFNLPQPKGGRFLAGELLGGGHNCAEKCQGFQIPSLTNVTLWPVDTSTGNFWHTFSDLTIPGRGPAIDLNHTYNSMAAATDGPLGYGWTHSYNFSLSISGTAVTVNQENGAQVTFQKDPSGAWVAPPRVDATLVQNGTTWTFTRRAKEIFSFDASGNLTSEKDLNGYVTTVGPKGATQTITDPAGRTLTFTFSGSHITRATDSASPARSVSFAYDGSGNLSDVTDVNGGITHFTYDANHRLRTLTPPNQHDQSNPAVLTNIYDTAGRVTSQTDPVGRTTSLDYTSIPGSTKVTDSQGNVSVYTYVEGLLVSLTNGYGTPKSATTSYTYDQDTLGVTSVTDPNGHTTTMSYDGHGNLLSATDPLGNTEHRTYDALEDLASVQDPNGVVTTSAYDGAGHLLSTSTPLVGSSPAQARTTSYGYDASHAGDVVTMTDPNGAVWHQVHDATTGYVTSVSDPMTPANTTTYCYDSIGRRTKVIGPKGTAASVTCSSTSPALSLTTAAYDNAGHVTQVTDPLGHSTIRHYDADGNLKDETDANNHITRYVYNADDEVLSVTRPDNTVVGYGYDTGGNRTLYTDGANQPTRWTFDDPALPHLPTSIKDADIRTTTVAYDRAGNRTSLTDPAGQTTGFAYDAADRLVSATYSDGQTPNVTNITHDADGRRTGMTDGTGTSSWVWDSLGRMTSSTNGAGQTVGYHYDLKGQLKTLDYPGLGSVTRNYDAAGRLTDVTDWASHHSIFGYDGDSFLTSTQYPNGTTATDTPDNADRLMGMSYAKAGTTFASFSYGRNVVDSVNSVTSTGVPADNHSYLYTALDQLQNVDSTAYAYDAADNATSLADGTGQSFDAANQLCWRKASTPTGSCTSPPSGATTYGYDSRGNRTTATPPSGPVTTLGYDQANRLTSYGTTATYAYDGDGIRASKTVSGSTTRFTWDEAASLPQLLLDGSTAYVYGPGGLPLEQVSGSTVRYYHHDQLGSTRAMTDSTGVVVGTWTYDSYGKVTGSTGSVSNPFGYAGQYTDAETGFQYLRARYYDPVTAQFLTRDPAVATTHSAYGYTGGNPLNGTDPSGLDWRQTIANGAGGVLNGLTLGHEKTVTGWLGISDHVDRCSGAYAIGNEIGKGILVTVATGAAGELLEGAAAVEGGASEAGPTVLSDGAGASPEEIARSTGGPTGGSRVGQSEVRQQLLDEADGSYRCWRCGQESTNPDNMQVGHRNVPTSQGGNLEPENVCLEGASCNLSAGNRGRPSPGMSCVERGGCGAPYGRYD